MKKLLAFATALALLFSPAVAFPACSDANIKLLLHENGNNTDASLSGHTMTDGSSVTYSNTTVKLGSHSATFNSTADSYQSTGDSTDWHIGTQDFTMSAYINFSTLMQADFKTIVAQYDQGSGKPKAWRFYFFRNFTSVLRFQVSAEGINSGNLYASNTLPTVSTGVWHHVEIDRSGTTYYFFFDGVQVGTGTMADDIPDVNQSLLVGACYADSPLTIGQAGTAQFDEVLVVVGVALHTSDFTPPTTEYCSGSASSVTAYASHACTETFS